MKILLVGEFDWPWYQEACAKALESLGCRIIRFGWLDRFKHWHPGKTEPVHRSLLHRLQYRFIAGPTVNAINSDLVRVARESCPDVVWFYNVQFIYPKTVSRLKELLPTAVFCQYANDNPFSPKARKSMWRHFLASIPLFDIHHAYRESNIAGFAERGAKQVFLLKPYFIPESDFPLPAEEIEARYKCDVVFAGHYELDGRVAALEAVCRAGYKLNLFGGGWDVALPKLAPYSPLRALYPICPAIGPAYPQAICGAKVALSFLSTLNQDTYTRRSFQIPAMKTPMLSQRTEALAQFFAEGEEAEYFSDTQELLEKIRVLVRNPSLARSIAERAYDRVYRDGHDVGSRMKQWLAEVSVFKGGACKPNGGVVS